MGTITRAIGIAAVLVGSARAAAADVVTDWIDRAVAVVYRSDAPTPLRTRNVALVAIAMFDALNAITPRYTPYRAQPATPAGASPDAAAAAAAHYLLIRLYPAEAARLDAAFQGELAAMPESAHKADGIVVGERAAARLLEERSGDGSAAPNTYRPVTTAGSYVPTTFPLEPAWGSVKPFALQAGNQFRPGPPYALGSAQWATDYNEVKRLGALTGSQRTPEQTTIARFWEFGGPGTYMPVARGVVMAKRLGQLESARIYALAAMTGADALIAVFDAKYTYGFWRPVTAIRNGDRDGNDATERDSTWEPFIATPMHPEYPCAHCITQSSVATVLAAVVGDTVPFTLSSPSAPGVTRSFSRLSDYAAEVVNARVYDGVHYRTSGNVGAAMGRQIGAYIAGNLLTPLR